jgi:trehalose 6-phosphate phosphatase
MTRTPSTGAAPTQFDVHSAAVRGQFAAASELLLCLDFDGTLAPIVADPARAELLPAAERALEAIEALPEISTAVVSGRGLDDLRERVPVATRAGNHGLELERDGAVTVHPIARKRAAAVQGVCDQLKRELAPIPNTRIENKRLTGTVHVRSVPPDARETVRETTHDVITDIAGDALAVSSGKRVLEISPAIPWHKGAAVRLLAADHPDDTLVVYIGDDVSDETAFRALGADDIGVKVGAGESTAATYTATDPTTVAEILEWIGTDGVTLLQSSRGRADRHADP